MSGVLMNELITLGFPNLLKRNTYHARYSFSVHATRISTELTINSQLTEAYGDVEESSPTGKYTLEVYEILLHFVPVEIAQCIMREANYRVTSWDVITTRRTEVIVRAEGNVYNSADECYLVSAPIPKMVCNGEVMPPEIKMVKFVIRSCDQGGRGWAGARGTYNDSWTWFEAGIIRPTLSGSTCTLGEVTSPQLGTPKRWEIQRNVRASRSRRVHEVTWVSGTHKESRNFSPDGKGAGAGFVEALKTGDRIAIMARALYPGFENHVSSASIEIFYRIF